MKRNNTLAFLTATALIFMLGGCQQTSSAAPSADGKYLLSEKIEYDYSGLLAKKVVTKYSYDENGLLTAEECSDGSKILYEYNENGEEIKETAYNSDGSEDYCYRTEYDENGNITLQESDFGCETRVYREDGTLKECVRKDLSTEQTLSIEKYGKYENTIESTHYNYDGTENYDYKLRTEIDGNKIKRYEYDDNGNEYYSGYEIFSDDGKISDTYRPDGKLYIHMVFYKGNEWEEITRYYETDKIELHQIQTHDENGKRTSLISESFNEDGSWLWSVSGEWYLNDGNLTESTTYDDDGRCRKAEYFSVPCGDTIWFNEYYTDTGEKTAEVITTEKKNTTEYKLLSYENDTSGYSIMIYDKNGNKLSEEGDFNLNGTRKENHYKTEYTYTELK